jgi:histidinol-phosphate aminotransferase
MKNNKLTRRALLKGALITAGSVAAAPILGQTHKTQSAVGAIPRVVTGSSQRVSYGPSMGIAKLNANENPYGPSPMALRAMEEAIKSGSYYVSAVPELKAMIAERNNVTPEHILIGSGSSAPLQWLATKVTKKGHILGPDLFWDTTTKMGSANNDYGIKRLSKTKDLSIDLTSMYNKISSDIEMVQVTNPNNPTGLTLSTEDLRLFCKKASKKAIVLIDEAYNELTSSPDENTMIPLINEGYNVVVARTFSKIYGLAGMRVGYMIADPELISKISSFGLGDYSLNQAGVAAAIASYNDEKFLRYSKEKIVEARDMLQDAVKENGLKPLPTSTNFMFVDLGSLNAEEFRKEMEKEKVLVRGIYQDYVNWSRVSTGKIADVKQYIKALPKVLDKIS